MRKKSQPNASLNVGNNLKRLSSNLKKEKDGRTNHCFTRIVTVLKTVLMRRTWKKNSEFLMKKSIQQGWTRSENSNVDPRSTNKVFWIEISLFKIALGVKNGQFLKNVPSSKLQNSLDTYCFKNFTRDLNWSMSQHSV